MLTTFTVNTLEDVVNAGDAFVSLREAISSANSNPGADTIQFSSEANGTLTLTLGELNITDTLTIAGNGTGQTVLDANGRSRVMHFEAATGDLTLQGLTIRNGDDVSVFGGGGVAFDSAGQLTVTNSTIAGNRSASNGGGIRLDAGALTLTNSTVSGNTALFNGGGINSNSGSMTLINSTISGNAGFFDGGGLATQAGAITLRNSTVAFNSAYGGGGIYLFELGTSLTATNSIIARNSIDSADQGPDVLFSEGTPVTLNHTLIGDNTGTTLTAAATADANGNLIGSPALPIDPLLGPLADNGGPTKTHALLAGSPAINAGSNTAVQDLQFDQRGNPFARTFAGTVDLGAFETQPMTITVTTNSDVVDAQDGHTSLREAISLANSNPGADTILFNQGLSGSILMSGGEFVITESVTITGNGSSQTILDAHQASRVLHFTANTGDLNLSGLTIRNGKVVNRESGGGIQFGSTGTLSLTNSTVSENTAKYGGGVRSSVGAITLTNSTVSGNTAQYGGGVYAVSGAITLTNSTVSGNSASSLGGGVYSVSGAITLNNSTVSGNTAKYGGGVIADFGAITLTNSTVSGNTASSRGGGVYSKSGVITLTNSTVSGNTASDNGGGIYLYRLVASLMAKNSIIAGNTLTDEGSGPDIFPIGGTRITLDHTLIGNNAGTNLTASATPDANGNLIGSAASPIDPRLGSLADNGGPTKTHALLPGSPAINAGSNAAAQGLQFDQRGATFPRIFGINVDMGAFESQDAQPITITVTTNLDVVNAQDGLTSLREAISQANSNPGADTILFAPEANGTILMSGSEFTITEAVTITGNGSSQTILDAQQNSRVLHFTANTGDLNLNGLTIRNGKAPDNQSGGGILFDSSGTLSLTNITVSGNSAADGGGVGSSSGAITLTNSTLSGNSAGFAGGGVVSLTGEITLTNSTVSGNTAASGGGVASETGAITLTSSTVSGNTASIGGGGIVTFASAPSLTATNSIIAGNTLTGQGSGPDIFPRNGASITLDHTLIGNNAGTNLTASATPDANGNLIGSAVSPIDPRLGALANNGGPTQTHALLPGSPAINTGSNTAAQGLQFDQRGSGFSRVFGINVDMGAFEFQAAQPITITVTTNSDVVNAQDGLTSLREAIAQANSNPGADTILFAQGLSGSILMTGGEFVITESVTITGNGSSQTILDAQQNSRVLHFTASTGDLNLSGLTIRNGKVGDGERGGGIRFDSTGTLSLTNSTVSGNSAGYGGGVSSVYGAITLTNSTVSGNAASFGGGVYSNFGAITLTNSTVSGNAASGNGGGGYSISGAITLTDSTVSGNTANFNGGGVFTGFGSIVLSNSTVQGNIAKSGGGIFLDRLSVSLTATNSIIAGNILTTGGSGPDLRQNNANLITLNHTLVGDNSGTTLTASATPDATGSLIGSGVSPINPLLGPLADNGGPTKTHALLAGSPAINAGSNTGAQGLQFDQRGATFPRIFGINVDMGAFESQEIPSLTIKVTTNSDVVDAQDGQTSLREAIALANNNPGADTIVFAPEANGTILMTAGEFLITDTVTITGNGSTQTILDAQQQSSVLHFRWSTGDLHLSGLTVQNGLATGSTGGGIMFDADGALSLTDSLVSGNTADQFGGGVFAFTGTISLTNTTVSGNTAISRRGGGVFSNSSSISLTNSTVSGNTAATGGGVATYDGSISLTNSTVSGNTAETGGGLHTFKGSISLANSTVSRNIAKSGGGAYLVRNQASITATNSIVAGNNLPPDGNAPDVMIKNNGAITFDHTLLGDNTGTTLVPSATPDAHGNLIGSAASPIDPLLGPLTDNGGATKTHALLAGSPAINAGSNTGAQGLQFDQRGPLFARVFGGTVDLGAYEFSTAVVEFSASTSAVSEGTATTAITVNLSVASLNDVTIPFTISGTAGHPDDFNIAENSLVIPAGQTSATINVSVTDDLLDENDETVILTLGTPTNAVLGTRSVHTLTIQDNDAPPQVRFELVEQSVNENAGTVNVTVQLTAPSTFQIVVPFLVSGTAGEADFTIAASPLIIPAGQTSATIAVNVINDSLDENDETVIVTLGSPTGATLGAAVVHTLTIQDDDINLAPTVPAGQEFSIAENSAAGAPVGTVNASDSENDALTFAILNGEPSNPFTINTATGQLSVSDPRPILNFEVVSSYLLHIRVTDAANNSSTQSVTVNLTDVAEVPVLSGGGASVSYIKKRQPVALFPDLTITSTDAPSSINKFIVSYRVLKGGSPTDVTTNFSALGQVVVTGPTDFKRQAGDRTLTVSLFADITIAQVQEALRGMRFQTKLLDGKNKPRNRSISVQVVDDYGHTSNTVTNQIRALAK